MQRFLFVLLCLLIFKIGNAQESSSKWQGHVSVGQYGASLVVPSFKAPHIGIVLGADYQWNSSEKHRLVQSGNLGYFNHSYVQHAVQLYTEVGYDLKLSNGLLINPFSIGGGYVFSISDMQSFEWNTSTQTYEPTGTEARSNWLISLGVGVGYESNLKIKDRPLTFFLDYRIQVQGIIVQQTVPMLAYAPIMLGVSLPID